MKTDDLIRVLAHDGLDRPDLRRHLALGLGPALVVALGAVWLVLGFRTDLGAALTEPLSVLRPVLTGGLGLWATRLVLQMLRPETSARLWPLGLLALAALGLWAWAYVTTPEEARQMATLGKTRTTCLVAIPLLSVLPVMALHHVLRQGAATDLRRAGFLAGLAGAGLSAAIYTLYCTEDSPLFYVTWYGLAILFVALVSTLWAGRSLRW